MKTPLFLSVACIFVFFSCKKDANQAPLSVPDIDVANVVNDSVLISKSYPGSLSACNSVDLVGRVSGTLISAPYKSGEVVAKGQILFQIEPTLYRDAVAQAQASLQSAQSQLEYASKNYAAMCKALESDAVSQIEVLQAKNAVETADAAVKNSKAALQTAQTNLGYCTVRAPFSGMVTMGNYSNGSFINGEVAPVTLATIYDNSRLWASFNIEDANFIKSFVEGASDKYIDYDNVPVGFGQPLPHSYSGKLEYIAPNIDTGTGTLVMKVMVENPYGELRSGMFATVDLPYELVRNAILVKDAAISTDQTKKFLYLVNDSDKVVYAPIQVGELANDSMRIVTAGLKGNERYVTKALLKVRPGMSVNPVLVK